MRIAFCEVHRCRRNLPARRAVSGIPRHAKGSGRPPKRRSRFNATESVAASYLSAGGSEVRTRDAEQIQVRGNQKTVLKTAHARQRSQRGTSARVRRRHRSRRRCKGLSRSDSIPTGPKEP